MKLTRERYDVTPNTAVYTSMGVVHRFQMFTPYENTAIVTPLEGEKRPQHLIAEEDGTPVPSARGFVVPGVDNVDPFVDPGARCPLSEFREGSFSAGKSLAERAELTRNEHWIVSEGELEATIEDLTTTLTEEDIVLMRNGAVRELVALSDGRAVIVGE